MASWLRTRKALVASFLGAGTATGLLFRQVHQQSLSARDSDSSKKLISVLMLTRHGARTPIHLISGIEEAEYRKELLEPYVKAKYKLKSIENQDFDDILSLFDQKNLAEMLRGGIGRGQLTSTGEKQLFDLGRIVRKKYVEELKFLSPVYDPNEFYARSTHFKRTINSAKSLLAGIYLNSHNEVPKEPFIINVEHLNQDILFPNSLACPYLLEARPFFEKMKLLQNQEYMNNLKALKRALPGGEDDSEYNFTAFRDDILARKVHHLPVPKHLEPFLDISHRYGNMEMTAQHDFNLKLSCGLLLSLLKQNLVSSVENATKQVNQDKHKFRLYSAHDTTINAILSAFDLITDENHDWPPFAANIIIELWQNVEKASEKYMVKFYYCGEQCAIPSCKKNGKNEHDFNEFLKIIDSNTIERDEFNKLCNQKFSP